MVDPDLFWEEDLAYWHRVEGYCQYRRNIVRNHVRELIAIVSTEEISVEVTCLQRVET